MLQKLTVLRNLMSSQQSILAAYIVPTSDAHNSEYIAAADSRRQWLTGFTGSAGTALVTPSQALVWTDGRYYTQFEKEVDTSQWTLMKQSLPDTPTLEKWISSNLSPGSVVGADPKTISRRAWTPLQMALTNANMTLQPVSKNLIDEARYQLNEPSEPRPNNTLIVLPLKYTGKTAGDKVRELRLKMEEKKVAVLILAALDEIAYTLNLRGSDIPYNPVFFSYLVIKNGTIVLFWGDGILPDDVVEHLNREGISKVECRRYEDVFQYLEEICSTLSNNGQNPIAIWLSHDASEALHMSAAGVNAVKTQNRLVSEVSPVALAKVIKNPIEMEGMRQCHIRDGTAVIRFFSWLQKELKGGAEITEIQAADKLEEFRRDESDFMGPSFQTISGAGENGAIIHYSPTKEGEQYVIKYDQMYLLDSGGQYRDGTTDITRTRFLNGKPSSAQKAAFTRVLKGQMLMGSALFPKGVQGNVLDTLARKALWDVGLDYAHGTGHGVGHFLNVHEGPSGISYKSFPDDPGLTPGMVFSNEPGYYQVGEYGIRHEDLVEVIEVNKSSNHPKASTLIGDYDGRGVLGFSTMTMVPHDKSCIDVSLLADDELEYLNTYHQRVFNAIGPILERRGFMEAHDWLRKECTAIIRNA